MLSVGKGTDLDATNEERCPLAQILKKGMAMFDWEQNTLAKNETIPEIGVGLMDLS